MSHSRTACLTYSGQLLRVEETNVYRHPLRLDYFGSPQDLDDRAYIVGPTIVMIITPGLDIQTGSWSLVLYNHHNGFPAYGWIDNGSLRGIDDDS